MTKQEAELQQQEDELQQHEWEALYEGLIHTLAGFGVNDPYGNGQYYIGEDNNGDLVHKVKVFELPLINHHLVGEIQRQMSGFELEWQVFLVLELFDPDYTGQNEGIAISENHVEERWDKQRIKREVGDTVAWNP